MTRPPGLLPPQLPTPPAPQLAGRLMIARSLAAGGGSQIFRLLPAGSAAGFEARVASAGEAGGVLLRTPRGSYLLESGPPLEPGSRIRLMPASVASRAIDQEARARPAELPLPAGPGLPSARADGALAASLLRLLTSSSEPGRLPAKAAEPGGGEPIAGARSLPDGWRMLPLLLTGAGDMALVRIFHRSDDRAAGPDDEGKPEPAQRLLLEVDWSRLGKTQIDLLVGDGRADVRVRSRRKLPGAVKTALQHGFAAALEAGRLTGTLGFVSPELAPLPTERRPLRPPDV